jgi:DNA polymerase III subunit gamma/tau
MSCRYDDNHPDISEMNMADTRGIDDVRALVASSKNNPTIGDHRVFIIDEVHAVTPQAAQALLKPLEEPPTRTLWILATTNPEKLPGTILGRCHQFALKKLDEASLRKRLLIISKREGAYLKDIEGYEQILSTIITLGNGRMRDSIQLLESVIYGIRSGDAVDPKTILSKFLTTPEAELDQAAADLLASVLAGELKGVIKAVRGSGNARGVMHKLRWLIQYLLDQSVGLAKFQPWSAKQFAKAAAAKDIKMSLMKLVKLQNVLLEMEMRFNTLSVEESITMLSMLGAFIVDNPIYKRGEGER